MRSKKILQKASLLPPQIIQIALELEEKLHEYQAEKRRKRVINATLATAVGIWLLVKSPLSK